MHVWHLRANNSSLAIWFTSFIIFCDCLHSIDMVVSCLTPPLSFGFRSRASEGQERKRGEGEVLQNVITIIIVIVERQRQITRLEIVLVQQLYKTRGTAKREQKSINGFRRIPEKQQLIRTY